jgi:hypothetical protein
VAYVSGGFLALTAIVGGAAVALTHTGGVTPAVSAAVPGGDAGALPPVSAQPAPPLPTKDTSAGSRTASGASHVSLHVPPLRKLTPPDVIVKLRHAASTHSVAWLRRQPGIRRVVVGDRGRLVIHGTHLNTLGVPVSTIRGFTPSLTASSNALWQSIARGELTVAYANGRHLRHDLGNTFDARGPHRARQQLRIGAFATIGLDGAQALLSHPAAVAAGLKQRQEVLVVAPKATLDTMTGDLRKAFGAKAKLKVTRAPTVDQSQISQYAVEHIPSTYLDLYRRAAVTCPGLPWTVLAGIGTVETGNGTNVHKSTAGAIGPMQFIPSTWAMYGYDADGDGKANIHDPTDSVFSAARYLCAAGAGLGGQSLDNAIFSYNHAWWYVRMVINIANSYV